ncbi:MAG: hypothetical protein AAGE80_00885 [Pseudomonadota bacterium]
MLRRRAMALSLLLAIASAEAALAGAWTRAEGEGLLIFSSGRRAAPVSALASALPEDESNTTQILVEYGLFDEFTLGATLFADLAISDFGSGALNAGVFGRYRIWQGAQSVFSVQLGYAHPLEEFVSEDFGATNFDSGPEIEMRLLYGHGIWGDWGSAFVSAEAGYDVFLEGIEDDIRADVTFGYEPWRCCLFLMSAFATVPTGEEDPSFKLAPSFAYTLWPEVERNGKKPVGPIRPRTIQFGINYDLLNSGDGLGVQVSIWKRF